MIDEKKLIERLENIQKNDCKSLVEIVWFDGVLAIVESQPKVDKWILPEERMPEEHKSIFAKYKGTERWTSGMFEKISDDVIATVEYEDGNRKTIAMHTIDGKWKFPNKLIKQKVIAWMPLPDSYAAEYYD